MSTEPRPKTTPADLLRAARVRLASPDKWLHDSPSESVTADGEECLPTDPAAARWDVYGALGAEGTVDTICDLALEYLGEALKLDGLPSVFSAFIRWHDAPDRTHAEVLVALELAAQLAASDPVAA